MRNLKKFLALVLAMVMAFSLMLSASAVSFEDYKDTEEIVDEFQEAVQVLTGLKVFTGDEDASGNTKFRPADTITRAEAAAIVYRVATGDVDGVQVPLYADYNHFADVNSGDWFAGYVGFCQNAGIIKGTTPTTFSPYLPVTGYEMLAMLLRVIGYGKDNEFVGSSWQVNVAARAEALHITDSMKDTHFASTLNMAAQRQVVAELTFVTLVDVPTVTWSSALGYSDREILTNLRKNPTQGQKIFGLYIDDTENAIDDWGRPGYYWMKDGKDTGYSDTNAVDPNLQLWNASFKDANVVATIKDEPIVVYTTAKTECDIIHENTEWSKDTSKNISSLYLNGVGSFADDGKLTAGQDGTDNNTIEALGTNVILGAQGRIMEIYDMSLRNARRSTNNQETDVRVVMIDTYLARVDRVKAAGTDVNGHPTDATVDLTVYAAEGTAHTNRDNLIVADDSCPVSSNDTWDFDGVKAEGFSVGDYVLVYIYQDLSASDELTHNASYAYSNKFKISGVDYVNEADDNIVKAEIKNGGYIRSWTNGTMMKSSNLNDNKHLTDVTYIGTTQFNDAEKFCANWRVKNIPWSVAVDRYGNAIGLVNFSNYLAIEKIEWKHGTGFGDDYALADLLLASGEKVSSVKVSSVNNVGLTNARDDYGVLATKDNSANTNYKTVGTVSDYYTNNGEYYCHIFTYAVNEDGTYTLGTDLGYGASQSGSNAGSAVTDFAHTNGTNPHDLDNVTITRGEATIYGTDNAGSPTSNINTYTATDNTVFAIWSGYSYTVYTGKDSVPSMSGAHACVMVGENGYAEFVVVRNANIADNTFLAYITDVNADTGKYNGGTYVDGFNVYKLGETTPTVVYTDNVSAYVTTPFATDGTGLYLVKVNGAGVLTQAIATAGYNAGTSSTDDWSGDKTGAATPITSSDVNSGAGFNWDNTTSLLARVGIKRGVSGSSFMAQEYTSAVKNANTYNGYSYTAGNALFDLNVTADTKIIVVNVSDLNGASATLSTGDIEDVTDGSIAYVTYNTKTVNTGNVQATIYNAENIYVYKMPVSMKLTEKVTIDSVLSVDSATIHNTLPAYRTVDGTADQALAAAKADPYTVSLADVSRVIGSTGSAWTFSYTAATKAGNAAIAVSSTDMALYSGATPMPNSYNPFPGTATSQAFIPSVGDQILIAQYDSTNVVFYYTVINIVP